jgi:hypothetical protein
MTRPRFAIGDRVRLKSTGEVGVVVWVWHDEVVGYDHHVAFFGNEFPPAMPAAPPYVLRYAAASLEPIDTATDTTSVRQSENTSLFDPEKIDHGRMDISAIVDHRGIAAVDSLRAPACERLLKRQGYLLVHLDCSLPFPDVLLELGRLLRWEEQFGYRLGMGRPNLDALADGFEFDVPTGGMTFVLRYPEALAAAEPDGSTVCWQFPRTTRYFSSAGAADSSSSWLSIASLRCQVARRRRPVFRWRTRIQMLGAMGSSIVGLAAPTPTTCAAANAQRPSETRT